MRILLACLALSALCGVARCDSLWKPESTSLFADHRAQKVGDLVTINIVENSVSTQNATTDVSKKSNVASTAGVGPLLSLLPKLGFTGAESATGQGSTSRASSLLTRMTARITEVKPNGVLTIEGSHSLVTNKDTQIMKITGVIRSKDISPDNVVLSTSIADARIEITGHGPIGDRQKPGLVNRLAKLIF